MSQEPPSSGQSATRPALQRVLGRAWGTVFAACGVLACVEVAIVASRGDAGAGLLLRYLGSEIAVATWVSLLAAAVFTLIAAARLASPLPLGLVVGGVGVLVLRPWNLLDDPYHLSLVVPALGLAAGAAGGWARRRLGPRAFAAGAAVGAAGALLADAFVLHHLYPTLHHLAGFAAVVLGSAALWDAGRRASPRRGAALAALAVVGHVALLGGLYDVRALGLLHGTLQPQMLGVLHLLVDLDRDGHAGVLGGGDCDDLDAAVGPGRCEVPGNGVDDNCNGLTDPAPPAPRAGRSDRQGPAHRPDVYLIVADTLRADLGGVDRAAEAPAFAAWVARGVEYARAYTPYPETYRALLAMAQSRPWRYVGDRLPSLLDLLARAGWDVQLWMHRHRLPVEPGARRPLLALPRATGNPFRDDCPSRPADKSAWTAGIIDGAIAELAQAPGTPPRVRWLHLMDTHAPPSRTPSSLPLRTRYAAEVRHLLSEVGRLLDALAASERGRRAVVVLMSDHGEALGEHDGFFHGATLYEEALRVPLVIHAPGVAPTRVQAPVSLLDVAPTLLGVLGLPRPAHMMGHSLLEGAPPAPRVLGEVAATDHWGGVGIPATVAVLDPPYKLVSNVDENVPYLYDLSADPGELRSVAPANPDVVRRLREALARWEDLPGCRPRP